MSSSLRRLRSDPRENKYESLRAHHGYHEELQKEHLVICETDDGSFVFLQRGLYQTGVRVVNEKFAHNLRALPFYLHSRDQK
jgi:hypothetical protein